MKSNLFSSILFSSLLFICVGCNQHGANDSYLVNLNEVADTKEASSVSGNSNMEASLQKTDLLQNLKIIKNAQCRFKVADVDSITKIARSVITEHSGYISEMRFTNDRHRIENRFTVRVPQEQFEVVLDALSDLAEFVEVKDISSTDVSEEYIDLQSRLQTKLEVKQRYDLILRTKAKTVEEVLLAEEKLRVLQEEIEAAQGRLQFLSSKVALSTIQVDLYETVTFQEQPERFTKSFGAKIAESMGAGWNLLQHLVLGILYIWPLFILGIGTFLFWRYGRKK